MPIQATFQADFTDFQRAVTDAETSLRSFEDNASKVEGSLNRMADSFSGRKIISEATLMMEAIERVGGVSTLTEAELAKAGATAGEAAEKMKALGMDVPPGMQSLADTTKAVGKETSITAGFMGDLAKQMAGMFTVGAIVAFGREVLQTADQIQKMADQTGLAVGQVQQLQYIAGQSSTEMSSMVSAIQTMQEKLGSDDAGLIGGLERLGISLGAFKRMDAYDQLIAVADALEAIQDPADLATKAGDVFGNKWKELLPAIKSGMRELGEQTTRMSDEAVAGLAELGDAWDALKSRTIANTGELSANLMRLGEWWDKLWDPSGEAETGQQIWRNTLTGLKSDAEVLAGALEKVPAPLIAIGEPLKDVTLSTEMLAFETRQLDEDMRKSESAYKATEDAAKKVAEELEEWEAVYDAVNEQGRGHLAILAEIDPALTAHVTKLLEAGASARELAEAYGLSAEEVGAMQDKVALANEVLELQAELYLMQIERSGTATDVQRANLQLWADDYKRKLGELTAETAAAYALIDQIVSERTADMMVDWGALRDVSRASLQETADIAWATYDKAAADTNNYSFEAVAAFERTALAAQAAADNWSASFGGAAEAMGDAASRGADRVSQEADRAALSWSEAMDLVATGQGTMTGQVSLGDDPAGAMASWVEQLGNIGRLAGPINKAPAELFPADPVRAAFGGGGGTTTMTNTFNVNGTGADIARTVSEEITRLMRVGRKWPAV